MLPSETQIDDLFIVGTTLPRCNVRPNFVDCYPRRPERMILNLTSMRVFTRRALFSLGHFLRGILGIDKREDRSQLEKASAFFLPRFPN